MWRLSIYSRSSLNAVFSRTKRRRSFILGFFTLFCAVPRLEGQQCYAESPHHVFSKDEAMTDDEKRVLLRELPFYLRQDPDWTAQKARNAEGGCVKLVSDVASQDPKEPYVYLNGEGFVYQIRMAPYRAKAPAWQQLQWRLLATYMACAGRPVTVTFAASYTGFDSNAHYLSTWRFPELAAVLVDGAILDVETPDGRHLSIRQLAQELRKEPARLDTCETKGRHDRW
jgi:hypothetical protein